MIRNQIKNLELFDIDLWTQTTKRNTNENPTNRFFSPNKGIMSEIKSELDQVNWALKSDHTNSTNYKDHLIDFKFDSMNSNMLWFGLLMNSKNI